jgi:peptide/nickel transport system substrate-binding protein
MYAEEYNAGKLSRREFLTRSTALGVGAAAAYSMIGLKPAQAQGMVTPADGRQPAHPDGSARAEGPAHL